MTAPTDRAAELLAQAQQAAALRTHQTDPAVVALAVERSRRGIEAAMWIGIALGMAFTTVTVQQWAARGADLYSVPWWSAWLLAPLVEAPLLAILRGEQTASRYNVEVGPWARRARWSLLVAAYVMNTFEPWSGVLGGRWGWDKVLLHSVPVLAVLLGAEALTDLRVALGLAVTRAGTVRAPRTGRPPAPRTTRTPAPADVEPDDEPDTATGEVGKRAAGVTWALANWDDPDRDGPLRPLHVRDHMLGAGNPVSKGEASKIMADVRRQRVEAGLPVDEPDRETAGVGA